MASPSAGTISLLTGDGLGNLAMSKTIALGLHQPQFLVFGDTGGDGAEDLLGTEAGDPGSGAGNLLLLCGGVAGPECAPQKFPAGAQPFGLAIGDTNQDGRPDVIVANQGSGTCPDS